MKNDNTTPMHSGDYDNEINKTIPFYSELFEQTFDVIEQCGFSSFNWLDLGCGTGNLEELALERFAEAQFVLVDPSENMLKIAKEKLNNDKCQYVCCSSYDITYDSAFEVVTAIQSHHYMHEEERKRQQIMYFVH